MKRKGISISLILLVLLITNCGPSGTNEASTATFTPQFTDTVMPTATRTNTPEPTSLPGVETIPLGKFKHGVPWLPYDEDRVPMTVYYIFNLKKPPFDDVLVRKAFAAAIDRELVSQAAIDYYFREAKPATSLTPADVIGRDLYGEVGIPFNPEKAKEYLAEAGYPDGEGFPEVTMWVYQRTEKAPSSYYRIATDVVAPMWKEYLGVTVKIYSVGGVWEYADMVKENPPQLFMLGWGADEIDPDNFLNELFLSSAEYNWGNFNNEEFDTLVEKASMKHEIIEKQAMYIEAEKLLCEEEAAIIPLYHCVFYNE